MREKYQPPADGSQVLFTSIAGQPRAVVFCRCNPAERQYVSAPTKDGSTAKIPKGWRKIEEEFVCCECVAKRFFARSFRVQIVGVAGEPETGGRTMEEFRVQLRAAAREAARYGNWLVAKLFAADQAVLTPEHEWSKTKLPPCPQVDLYQPAMFPRMSPAGMTAVAQMVRGWYSERRFDALVKMDRSVESYRFGYLPVEVRAADWKIVQQENKYIFRGVTIAPGKSWALRVFCDPHNLGHLKACVAGDALPLGLKIVRRTKQPIPGGNGKPVKAWFFRVSVLLPRKPKRQSHQEITLTLGHDGDSLLFGTLDGKEEVFEFPGVEVRKQIVGGDRSDRHRQTEQSLTRGLMPRRKAQRWGADRTRVAGNRVRKIAYQLHLAASALVRWCRSHGVTSVDYDTADRGFVPHFPWRELRDNIACGLEAENIGLHVIGEEPAADVGNMFDFEALAGPGRETGE